MLLRLIQPVVELINPELNEFILDILDWQPEAIQKAFKMEQDDSPLVKKIGIPLGVKDTELQIIE